MKDTRLTKAVLYKGLRQELKSVLQGEANIIARYASAACLIHQALSPRAFWTGFYLVDEIQKDELVIGPYQGSLGCLRIPFGANNHRGVCGVAAFRRETQIVADVHAYPGHIACDSRSNSEIVVPLIDNEGALHGVLDIDSEAFNAFDEEDSEGLGSLIPVILQSQ